DDAFFVCDLGDVVKKYVRWQKNFPRIVPYYAIKCNPDETMLKLMIGLGAGFDCASKAEIRQMLSLGASPEKIIFANPCKQTSHVRYAKENNIKPVVFDNKEELVKMKKNYPNADLVLRIQTDDSQSVCPFSMKYGAHPDSCPQLLDTAYKMGLNVVGISFHVGSGCTDVQAFVKAIQNARVLFDYAESIGYHFTLLDIGGGFPGTENVDLKFEEIASMVNLALDDLFPKSDFPHVQIIAEPGRYFAASAYTLATNIIAKRAVLQGVPGEEADSPKGKIFQNLSFMYYVNDGIYGSFNCLFFDHAQVTPQILKGESIIIAGIICIIKPSGVCCYFQTKQNGVRFSSSIWGPTCDGLDQICEHVMLPELTTGNWIIWEDMGAYTISAGSAFNGFKTTKMFYVI
uniref:ornithine decarboxylase n=1 Tax=Ciona savignyi TaxID=51511 RepID=H2ZI04_CIOSA